MRLRWRVLRGLAHLELAEHRCLSLQVRCGALGAGDILGDELLQEVAHEAGRHWLPLQSAVGSHCRDMQCSTESPAHIMADELGPRPMRVDRQSQWVTLHRPSAAAVD